MEAEKIESSPFAIYSILTTRPRHMEAWQVYGNLIHVQPCSKCTNPTQTYSMQSEKHYITMKFSNSNSRFKIFNFYSNISNFQLVPIYA